MQINFFSCVFEITILLLRERNEKDWKIVLVVNENVNIFSSSTHKIMQYNNCSCMIFWLYTCFSSCTSRPMRNLETDIPIYMFYRCCVYNTVYCIWKYQHPISRLCLATLCVTCTHLFIPLNLCVLVCLAHSQVQTELLLCQINWIMCGDKINYFYTKQQKKRSSARD